MCLFRFRIQNSSIILIFFQKVWLEFGRVQSCKTFTCYRQLKSTVNIKRAYSQSVCVCVRVRSVCARVYMLLVCVCIWTILYIYIYTRIHIHIYIYVYACVYVCVSRVCVTTCIYVVSMCVYVGDAIHVYIYICVCVYTCVCVYVWERKVCARVYICC